MSCLPLLCLYFPFCSGAIFCSLFLMLMFPVLFAARVKTSSLGASRAVSSLVTQERSGRTRSRIGVSQSQREYRALHSPLHVLSHSQSPPLGSGNFCFCAPTLVKKMFVSFLCVVVCRHIGDRFYHWARPGVYLFKFILFYCIY